MVMLVGSSRVFQIRKSAILANDAFKFYYVIKRYILAPHVYIRPYPVEGMGCSPRVLVIIEPAFSETSVRDYEQLVVRKSLAVKISNPIKQRLHPRLNIVTIFMLV